MNEPVSHLARLFCSDFMCIVSAILAFATRRSGAQIKSALTAGKAPYDSRLL